MAITERQRESRIDYIGSSDAAAIMGLNPWRTAADVRLDKLGLLEPDDPSELAEIGTALEDGIANLSAKRLGVKLVKPKTTFIHPNGVMAANVDRLVGEAKRGAPIVEIKDTGLDHGWGEAGSDEVPDFVLIQVLHQMSCQDGPEAHVARLSRGWNRGLFIYRIANDDNAMRIIEALEAEIPAWHKRHIIDRDPIPADQPPANMDILKRVRREPKSRTPIDPKLVSSWRDIDAAAKTIQKLAEEAKRRVLTALGDHEAGDSPIGVVAYPQRSRAAYSVEASTYRQIVFTPPKAA